MLSKLIKHDLLSNLPTLLLLSGGVLGLGIIVFLDIHALFLPLFNRASTIVGYLFILHIVISHSKSLFGEGRYLVFSLPARASELLIARLVTSFIEIFLFFLVLMTSMGMVESVSTGEPLMNTMFPSFSENMEMPVYQIVLMGFMIVSAAVLLNMTLLFLSVFLHTAYKGRFKPLIGLILFIAFVVSILLVFYRLDDVDALFSMDYELFMTIVSFAILLLPLTVFFFLSVYLLNHKLELK